MLMYRTIIQAAVMIAAFAVILLLLDHYQFFDRQVPKTEEQRASANLSAIKASEKTSPSGTYVIDRSADGHFWVDAYVNGDRVRFMVDTGASFVVLSPQDADYLGFDFWEEDYTLRVKTATGEFAMAPMTIDVMEIGDDITVYGVRGAVLNEGSNVSLLGLSFLNKLDSYQFAGDELILKF